MNYPTKEALRQKIGHGRGAVAVAEPDGLRIHGNVQRLNSAGKHSLECYKTAARISNPGKEVMLITNEEEEG